MYDCHLHTNYSYDGQTTMKGVCEISVRNGMKGICFTDHVELQAFAKEHENTPDYAAYKAGFEEVKALYGERLEMARGIELGLSDGIYERNLEEIKKAEPDFIIGSVHFINGVEVYNGSYLAGKTREQAYLTYLEHMVKMVKEHDYFCVLGHLDMILRVPGFENRSFDTVEMRLLVDDILKEIISTGRGIEVNASGWNYGLPSAHPEVQTLRRYKELGGHIITTGSDSHRFDSVNRDIDRATALLKELGFEYISYFKNMKEEKRKI